MSGILYPNSLGLATLEDAAYYLEEKYHKDGGGGDTGSGVLVVHEGDGMLDKTWQEIYDAGFSVLYKQEENGGSCYYLVMIGLNGPQYGVAYDKQVYIANTPNDYPQVPTE